jgi:casein kinase 1
LSYVRNLDFPDEPDYAYLYRLFDKVLKDLGEADDGIYDWLKEKNGKGYKTVAEHDGG